MSLLLGVFMAHPGLVHDHRNAAASVGFGQLPQVRRVFGVRLETDGADLLQPPVLGLAEEPLVERQHGRQGEGVGLVQLADLQPAVGAEVNEDVQTSIQRVRVTFVTPVAHEMS